MKRKVRPSDVRLGALLPQISGTLRVVKLSPDRQKVTVQYLREPGHEYVDPGARFAGVSSKNIYTWDGTGFWRGRGHQGEKHYLTIYRAPQDRAQEAAWMARLLRAQGIPNPMQTARRLARRGVTREQLEAQLEKGEPYEASGDPRRRRRTKRDTEGNPYGLAAGNRVYARAQPELHGTILALEQGGYVARVRWAKHPRGVGHIGTIRTNMLRTGVLRDRRRTAARRRWP